MNIHLKYCKKCKKHYDYPECPYCGEERIKKKGEENGKKDR